MTLGIIARATDRGLGIQSWEVARHLPGRVLLVDTCDDVPTYPQRFDGMDVTTVQVRGRGYPNRERIHAWLRSVDVVYTAETFYDPGFTTWARRCHARTVCHVNPEFYVGGEPTEWWSATPWRLDHLDPATQVVPFPVATERWDPPPIHDGEPRWLHVEGRRAGWDRNGTDLVLEAVKHLRRRCTVTIASQAPESLRVPRVRPGVTVEVVGHSDDYWSLYEGHDLLVMPRRYGGLCLPVQEAMGAGLGVLMPDVSPNPQAWPVATVPASVQSTESMYAGRIPVHTVSPLTLAFEMDRHAEPEVRAERQEAGRKWAAVNSWSVAADEWRQRLRL